LGSQSERQSIRQESECTPGGSRFPRLEVGERWFNHAHLSARPHLFSRKIISQNLRAPTPTRPNIFPIACVRLRRVSRRLLFSARPLPSSALLRPRLSSSFSLKGHHRAPNARPREGRGRGAARRGTSVAFRAEVRSLPSC
jgi:hypothetical protein